MKFKVGDRVKNTITGIEGTFRGSMNVIGCVWALVTWGQDDADWADIDYLVPAPNDTQKQPAENNQMEFVKGDRVKYAESELKGTVLHVEPYCVRVCWDDAPSVCVKYPPHCLIHIPMNPQPLKIDRSEVASQVRTPDAWAFKYGVSYALTGKFDPLSPKSTELWDEVQRIEKQMADEYSTYLELKRKFEGEGK